MVGMGEMDDRQRRWQVEITDQLPVLLARLLAAEDCAASPPKSHGVYLFSENETPMYVGRTGRTERSLAKPGGGHSNFRTRRAGHIQPKHNQGTYAYRLARIGFTEAGGVLSTSRDANCANPVFMEHFREQCMRVKAMQFGVVEIDNDRLAAVFEIYATTILETTNSFATS